MHNQNTRPTVVGHRGGFQPENTLLAFNQARQHGLAGVELDVWLTADNQLAVIHGGRDGKLSPLDGDEQPLIFEMTLAELRQRFE